MRVRRGWRFVFITALVLMLFAVRDARAAAPTDQLREGVNRVVKVLDDPNLRKESKTEERRASLRTIANEVFDFEEMTKRALARHWQPRTPAERREFTQLFAALLEHSYVSKIEQYRGERISYLGDSVDGDEATVRTKILTKQGTDVPLEYRMRREGDRWRVYDVVIEGMSLVANYRTQFNKVIQTSSYEDLVKRIKAKALSTPEGAKSRQTVLDGGSR